MLSTASWIRTMDKRDFVLEEWLTREEQGRLLRMREFQQYLRINAGPIRPDVLQGDEMRVEVAIFRDPPLD